jgi:hypothetical protein
MKKIIHILTFILLFIWQLPQNIIGLLFLIYFLIRGDLQFISYKKMCWAFVSKYMSGGISLGSFAFVSPYNAKKDAVIMHEQEGHTFDSKVFGPLYLFIIGIPSIIWAWLGDKNKCYYSFYTEKWANKHAGLEVLETANGRCFLSIKDVLGYARKNIRVN